MTDSGEAPVETRVELYSDTKTKPTAAMRAAIAAAEVGDEQKGEDPTTNALCQRVADILGKEAGVFLPSGTMCNEIAIAVHCRPGDEVIAHESAHIINFEGGGPSALSGVSIRALPGRHGVYGAVELEAAIRDDSRYAPRSRLVCFEQTSNGGGGTLWPLETLKGNAEIARSRGLAVHMDGARLLNAVVASGIAGRDYAAVADTLWLDMSKGLGCPVGAVLVGTADFIHEAWRWKQRIGGALRQSGILAAAGLHALDHHVERLAEDHRHARLFAEAIDEIPGVALDLEAVQTNIVYFDVGETGLSAPEVSARLQARGISVGAFDRRTMRAVTHLDVDEAGVREAAAALAEVIDQAAAA